MSYAVALEKAWADLAATGSPAGLAVKFLADEYSVDIKQKKVISLSCNVPAKDFLTILILHYLRRKEQGLPQVIGKWLTFREFSGIEGYFDAFRKRSIEPVIRKYSANPAGLFKALERLPAKKAEGADAAIIVQAFEAVPALIKVWKADEEFGADANILFDANIREIFCIEDMVVLAGIIGASL